LEMQYFRNYSPSLGRDMEMKVYGHAGRPLLFIPCQDGRFFDFEGMGLADDFSPWINAGQLMVFAIDTIDKETWSDTNGDAYHRIRRHEAWVDYITNEVVPFARNMANERNGWHGYPNLMVFGCSLGASHAVNLYLRRPDLFDGLLALSGIYTSEFGFGSYMDEVVYRNSPVHYMANMAGDHPFINEYNQKKGIICVGQGAWEQPDTTFRLKQIFEEKGINIWVDVWGHDVNHDWPWWHKMVAYFMPKLLGLE